MILVRSLLFDAFFYITMGVVGIALAPVAAVSRRTAIAIVRTYVGLQLSALRAICGLRVEVRGVVPTGPVLVASKHQSFLDVLILLTALESPRFVMKQELRFAPVFGWYARRLGCIPVDRTAGRLALEGILGAIDSARSDLGQLVIYPQGTRVAPGAYRPYRVGAAAAAVHSGLPCIPVATNAGVFWGRNSLLRRPGTAIVEFLEVLPTGIDQEALLAVIETRIESGTAALEREAGRV